MSESESRALDAIEDAVHRLAGLGLNPETIQDHSRHLVAGAVVLVVRRRVAPLTMSTAIVTRHPNTSFQDALATALEHCH